MCTWADWLAWPTILMSRKEWPIVMSRLTIDWWADWQDIYEQCWPIEWWAEIDVHGRGWLWRRSIWLLARRILHLRIWLLKPFLVGAKKTRLGRLWELVLFSSVGADCNREGCFLPCTINKDQNSIYSCVSFDVMLCLWLMMNLNMQLMT